MLRVYVAGPINGSGDREANCRAAEDLGAKLIRAGHCAFVPHANNEWMRRHAFTEDEALAWDFRWLDQCDVLVRMPGVSPGSDEEVARARRRQMVVVDLRDDGTRDCGIARMMRRVCAV